MKSLCFIICLLLFEQIAFADDYPNVEASPREPWNDFDVVEEDISLPWWEQLLLWPVNRIVDAFDMLRIDVGAGPAVGGVVRITRYAQAGYRTMNPGMLRVGAFGRTMPFLLEISDEHGFILNFVQSKDRTVCNGEVGVGLDVLLVGAYVGICGEEVIDFISGIFFMDIANDDLR